MNPVPASDKDESILGAILDEALLEESIEDRQVPEGGTHTNPGSAGHPVPGSGHDDAETVTVEDGPPRTFPAGEPGAFGSPESTDVASSNLDAEPR